MIASAEFRSANGVSQHFALMGNSQDIVVTCLCPIYPVISILLVCSRWCVGHEGYCCAVVKMCS